jgi:hypothetical protein
MQALKIMNAQQRALLEANYGKTDAESVGYVMPLLHHSFSPFIILPVGIIVASRSYT